MKLLLPVPTNSITMNSKTPPGTETQNSRVSFGEDESLSLSPEICIPRLISKFQVSLGDLGVLDASNEIESMSLFIYESMSNGARNYHLVPHVFDLIEGNVCATQEDDVPVLDAIAVLAALFHDCVYANVDGCLSALQWQKLQGAILEESAETVGGPGILMRIHPDSIFDPLLCMVLSIFGLEANQSLTPTTGLNEYLSAVIAVRELEQLVTFKVLVQIAVCIEATIPFRSLNDSDETALDRLHSRLVVTVETCPVVLTESECVEALQRAALLANEDVGNFASTDHAYFLDNTWSLLPETNKALRCEQFYTTHQFQFAVFKMHGFFSFLKPGLVFQQFRGVPNTSTMERLNANAAQNLRIGASYVAAKLIAVSCVAAFAELTGGDSPLSSFMGDLKSRKLSVRRLEDKLQLPQPQHAGRSDHFSTDVYQLLVHGRSRETSFDVKQSPASAYFYACMGDDGVKRVLESVTTYPMTPEIAKKFLIMLPRAALTRVVSETAVALPILRKDQVMAILQSLPCDQEERWDKKGTFEM